MVARVMVARGMVARGMVARDMVARDILPLACISPQSCSCSSFSLKYSSEVAVEEGRYSPGVRVNNTC